MKFRILILALMIIALHVSAYPGSPDLNVNISLQFDDVPISTVLNMMAQQYNLNLVQSGLIEGNISIKLDNVDLENALRAILASNGYNYYITGNIIVVKPADMPAQGELVVEIVSLNYITPAAAVNAVEGLLSPRGKVNIVTDPQYKGSRTGTPMPTQIVIIDIPDAVRLAADFIRKADKPEPQVAIEVRIVETMLDNDLQTGFKWPTSLTARGHGISTSVSGTTTSGTVEEAVGQIDLPDGKWEWGKLSVNELGLVLEFLEQSGNSKLVSDPKITTLNNHPAEIKVATVVPIQTINRFSEGGAVQDIVTFQDEEIGITLYVTPHITDDNQIILDVNPTVAEIIGYSGPADNQKPITSERSMHTRITVGNEETAVLGGLFKEDRIENEQKVFLLGSIPIIGGIFKHKSVQTTKTDLTIMITPRIITD
ncbi:MAG: secretin and TonB N-terminal domain-containing protein [Candidatus Zixiibacteriota bacterium]